MQKKSRILLGLEAAAAIATIIAVLISEDAYRFVTKVISLPVWLLVIAIVLPITAIWAFSMRFGLSSKAQATSAPDVLVLNEQPKLVSGSNSNSGDAVGSAVLKRSQGTFATWVYLQPKDQGIRRLVNNRYILGCALRKAKPYKGVIALCRGPMTWEPLRDPSWKIWLVDTDGVKKRIWTYPDGREFQAGWHLFVLRWNHDTPRLELLIDGRSVILANDYYECWPKSLPERAFIGQWPGSWREHYINTSLWRTQFMSFYASDDWVRKEMARSKPVEAA